MIDIYYIKWKREEADNILSFKSMLSFPRRNRMNRLQKKDDKVRCVLGELLLRYALHRDGKEFCTPSRDNNGKPYIPDGFFSLSHAGDIVALAYGGTTVGIDVEQIQERIEDFRSALSEEEQVWVFTAPDEHKNERFIQIWTLKESYLKMLGTGFLADPSKTTIATSGSQFIIAGDQESKLILKSVKLSDGIFLGICSNDKEIHIKQVHISEFIHLVEWEGGT